MFKIGEKGLVKMKWTEVCIQTTNEALESISNILNEAGANGILVEDPLDLEQMGSNLFGEIYDINMNKYPDEGIYIKAYFSSDDSFDMKLKDIKQSVNDLQKLDLDLGRNRVTLNEIIDEDWETAWKKYYKPVKITEKMTIVPTWEDYKITSQDELVIELDPGMAFGTGTHPTTMLSIQALEKNLVKDDLVIDVGCGSGVLSIAAGLLGAKKVYAFDLDPVAVSSTSFNVELNQLSDKVVTRKNNLLEGIELQADVIVSNILAEIIIKFVDDAWNNLKTDGLFITSGIIKKNKQLVLDELSRVGFEIIEVNVMDDWVCIVAKKNSKANYKGCLS